MTRPDASPEAPRNGSPGPEDVRNPDPAPIARRDGLDPAALARKYEAALERSLNRALEEFRKVQAEAEASEAGAEAKAEADEAQPVANRLGSFFPAARGVGDAKANLDPTAARGRPDLPQRARKARRRARSR